MYDIVGSLPPELVAQVVQYLGCVEDILRGQSVRFLDMMFKNRNSMLTWL